MCIRDRAYGDLNTDPDVIDKITKVVTDGDGKWGFWHWTLDWDALDLMDEEATYTIVVRGYHTTVLPDSSSFYEQFQLPIFVDTKGPVLKLYNVLEQTAPGMGIHDTLQLDIQEEIPD